MRDPVNINASVSAILPMRHRAWEQLIIQQNKRPLDSDVNGMQAAILEQQRLAFKQLFGSGIAGAWSLAASGNANEIILNNGSVPLPFLVDGRLFQIGRSLDRKLVIQLSPPPGSGTRDDLVWLECWYGEVQHLPGAGESANVSTAVYEYGGVDNTQLTNDLAITGVASARRIQARWRIRVGTGVDRVSYPAGMTSPAVLAQGGANAPVVSMVFTQEVDDAGLWLAGAGQASAGTNFQSVDGYVYAIPLCWVSRTAGVTAIPTSAISTLSRTAMVLNAALVDGRSVANASDHGSISGGGKLLVLDVNGRVPSAAMPTSVNADKVDNFDAHPATAPVAGHLVALGVDGKFPNSVLRTGSGNGLDADLLDGLHASTNPAANTILALDVLGKFPNSVLRTGSGNGLDADLLDGKHASDFAPANHAHNVAVSAAKNDSAVQGCGNSYTTCSTLAVNMPVAGTLFVVFSVNMVAGAGVQWEAGILIDSEAAPSAGCQRIIQTDSGQRYSFASYTLAAGNHTITLVGKSNTNGQSVQAYTRYINAIFPTLT